VMCQVQMHDLGEEVANIWIYHKFLVKPRDQSLDVGEVTNVLKGIGGIHSYKNKPILIPNLEIHSVISTCFSFKFPIFAP
jgi:hypothetical protein